METNRFGEHLYSEINEAGFYEIVQELMYIRSANQKSPSLMEKALNEDKELGNESRKHLNFVKSSFRNPKLVNFPVNILEQAAIVMQAKKLGWNYEDAKDNQQFRKNISKAEDWIVETIRNAIKIKVDIGFKAVPYIEIFYPLYLFQREDSKAYLAENRIFTEVDDKKDFSTDLLLVRNNGASFIPTQDKLFLLDFETSRKSIKSIEDLFK